MSPTITYTLTDEAPHLATYSLLPLLKTFIQPFGIHIKLADISLARRVLAAFSSSSQYLADEHKVTDDLAYLAKYVKDPQCCLIKLPNISASVAQLKACILELQQQGFNIPHYPEQPTTDSQRDIQHIYRGVLGSAVNPKLRDGNSDRRIPEAVKDFARNHPHPMGSWNKDSKTHVSSMQHGDFYANEKSFVTSKAGHLLVTFQSNTASSPITKARIYADKGAIIDGTFMSIKALEDYFDAAKKEAQKEGLILSLHLKSTMMKVADPLIFGVALRSYLKEVFTRYAAAFKTCKVDPRYGLSDILSKISGHPQAQDIQKDIHESLFGVNNPHKLAMVNSDKGISNLHVPSDIIIDASMAAMIRAGGKMWAQDGNTGDTKALIPDRTYASLYQETISFHKKHGRFDPLTMGSVANVGLMAKKAEEYGSHDTTFASEADGTFSVVDEASGKTYYSWDVEKGDIWRLCHTADSAVRDWIKLAITRTDLVTDSGTDSRSYFWLDNNRSHDRELAKKIKEHPSRVHQLIPILSYKEATEATLMRLKNGQDTIAITGNVLRDYLTDLFPILEIGTSAKMISQVSLLAGGGLFETGSGGSAPKHVQQFQKENHLRWDSLGEFLAVREALTFLAYNGDSSQLVPLLSSIHQATSHYLSNAKYPSRKCHQLDNRGSHFYFSLYLAEALAEHSYRNNHKTYFTFLAQQLKKSETTILEELLAVQGKAITTKDMGGYFHPNPQSLEKLMRPSTTWNAIIQSANTNAPKMKS